MTYILVTKVYQVGKISTNSIVTKKRTYIFSQGKTCGCFKNFRGLFNFQKLFKFFLVKAYDNFSVNINDRNAVLTRARNHLIPRLGINLDIFFFVHDIIFLEKLFCHLAVGTVRRGVNFYGVHSVRKNRNIKIKNEGRDVFMISLILDLCFLTPCGLK